MEAEIVVAVVTAAISFPIAYLTAKWEAKREISVLRAQWEREDKTSGKKKLEDVLALVSEWEIFPYNYQKKSAALSAAARAMCVVDAPRKDLLQSLINELSSENADISKSHRICAMLSEYKEP